jgi:hypothetical protein
MLGPTKFTQIGIFGLKINHLATLNVSWVLRSFVDIKFTDRQNVDIKMYVCT